MEARLHDLGIRIAACMKRHGFDERELLTRSIKRQLASGQKAARIVFHLETRDGDWFIRARSAD